MKLKTIYDSQDDIPEGYADLYTERNGKWELTGIEGVKTPADVERVQEALRKEKADHKITKTELAAFEGIDPAKVAENETALESATAQLEAINKDGRIDETKLEPIIAARVKQATAPLERDKAALERQLDAQKKIVTERDGEVGNLKSSITTDKIERQIRDAAAEAKLVPTAILDAVLQGTRVFEQTEDGRTITKDVAGVTPGLTPKEWLKDMEGKAPHWWPVSVGSGARGGSGGGPNSRANNPWSKEAWNLTAQGRYVTEHGEEKAKTLAESVGSKIGATKPTV
jgi:hypothetical protein